MNPSIAHSIVQRITVKHSNLLREPYGMDTLSQSIYKALKSNEETTPSLCTSRALMIAYEVHEVFAKRIASDPSVNLDNIDYTITTDDICRVVYALLLLRQHNAEADWYRDHIWMPK